MSLKNIIPAALVAAVMAPPAAAAYIDYGAPSCGRVISPDRSWMRTGFYQRGWVRGASPAPL